MNQLRDRLLKPLLWAEQDNFRNLAHLKGVEDLARGVLEMMGREGANSGDRQLVAELKDVFSSFDHLDLEQRKIRIKKALGIFRVPSEIVERRFEPDIPADWAERDRELGRSIQFVKGVGPKLSELLLKKDIHTIEDALYSFPRTYEDRRKLHTIRSLPSGDRSCFICAVERADVVYYHRSRKRIFEMRVYDSTGTAKLKWFHFYDAYVRSRYKKHQVLLVFGEARPFQGVMELVHPEVEILGSLEVKHSKDERELLDINRFAATLEPGIHYGRIVPIYSETEGLYQKIIRRILYHVSLDFAFKEASALPEEIRVRNNLCPIQKALAFIHFPPPEADFKTLIEKKDPYRKRLVFEELFLLSLGLAERKAKLKVNPGIAFENKRDLMKRCVSSLPFRLTGAQSRVINEVVNDMSRPEPMNRLIQGDVGCGKTLVALLTGLVAVENGYQVALMAPTEILAIQHFSKIRALCEPLGVSVALLIGSQTPVEKKAIYHEIQQGTVSIVIGTHALIQEAVAFRALGFCIIDEQHRFGVEQRAELVRKGKCPDMLVMTATPIPRTLSMTLYGDLDISVVDEMPIGRKPVITKICTKNNTKQMIELIRKELSRGGQAYFVYPLIAESEELDLKDATQQAEILKNDCFPEVEVRLLHGQMSQEQKESIMNEFKAGRSKILVSTTVIEVGVDVPQATVMVIENAERFGLSQLHQLRGRVGRGDLQSYCFLVPSHMGSQEIIKRLRIMEDTTDGFKVAEVDLELRGPGELLGTRQSGIPEFRAAQLPGDLPVLESARHEAFELLRRDPSLEKHPELRRVLDRYWKTKLEFARIG